MSRRVLLAGGATLLVAGGAGAALVGSSSDSGGEARIDVVFDDSRGLLPNQQVMIAGARVGSIDDVSLTAEHKARVHMRIDGRFAPFRRDATCTIRPQGLIAENYVDCDPGTPAAPELHGTGGEAPTVPVERTTQPVSMTDLFEVWTVPTSQRLAVLLSTLGVSTSGRGEDINAILRRANPTLAAARRTIRLLERQRAELARTIDDAGPVAAALAGRAEDLTALGRHAGRVATQTASQRGALAEGVRRLPALLREARPSLTRLDAVMRAGAPVLAGLERAAPDLNRLSADVPRLAGVARPALRALAPVLRDGARASRRAKPLSDVVRRYARESLPSALIAGEMLPTLEDRGFVTSLTGFLHNTALAFARYDEQGHLLPAHVGFSTCMRFATVPDRACGARAGVPAGARKSSDGPRRPKAAAPTPAASPPVTTLLDYLLG